MLEFGFEKLVIDRRPDFHQFYWKSTKFHIFKIFKKSSKIENSIQEAEILITEVLGCTLFRNLIFVQIRAGHFSRSLKFVKIYLGTFFMTIYNEFQWLGDSELRSSLSGRLILMDLICKEKDSQLIFTPCISFRIAGVPSELFC